MPNAVDRTGSSAAPPAAEVLRGMRGAIASLRAATETLQGYPGAPGAVRERLLGVIAEETERVSAQLRALEGALADAARADRRRRAPVPAGELVARLAATLTESGLACDTDAGSAADATAGLRLSIDQGALAQAVGAFFTALRRQSPVGACTLERALHERHLLIDVRWSPDPADIPRLLAWQGEALGAAASDAESGRLRAVVRAHDGEAWFALDRDGATARVRLLLPCI